MTEIVKTWSDIKSLLNSCFVFLLFQLKEVKKPIFVSEKKGCHLCHNTFSEPNVVCLPGGVPVHTQCVAQRVRDSPTKRRLTNSSNHTWGQARHATDPMCDRRHRATAGRAETLDACVGQKHRSLVSAAGRAVELVAYCCLKLFIHVPKPQRIFWTEMSTLCTSRLHSHISKPKQF